MVWIGTEYKGALAKHSMQHNIHRMTLWKKITPWHDISFRIFCRFRGVRENVSDRWISSQRASNAVLWCFPLFLAWTICWANSRFTKICSAVADSIVMDLRTQTRSPGCSVLSPLKQQWMMYWNDEVIPISDVDIIKIKQTNNNKNTWIFHI